MQVVSRNPKQGLMVLRPDSAEDLWCLEQVISSKDIVSCKTERKIKIGGEDDRKASVVRRQVFLKLEVEKTELSQNTVLRISGVVKEGPEDIPHGSHHTFNVEPGTVLTIEKQEWPSYQLSRIEEAVSSAKSLTLLLVFDREEAFFAVLKSSGVEILSKVKGEVTKKGAEGSGSEGFYSSLVKMLSDFEKRLKPSHTIVASPSFWKEYLVKEMDDDMRSRVVLSSCSEVSESAVSEILQRPELSKVLENDRAARESGMLEELLRAIAKGEACYGLADCKDKIDMGAVSKLCVSYSFLSRQRLEGRHKDIESLMNLAEKRGASVNILSSAEPDKKLDGLGGIAGVLRWRQQ